MNLVRTRFAPSPTGAPHIGNIRTALFAWLFAKHHNGKFVLRIEDTDQARLKAGSVKAILESLLWLGITIDEGVMSAEGGETGRYGPYLQSQRLSLYQGHVMKLLETGAAYPCMCDNARLEQLKKTQVTQGLPSGYDGKCRTRSWSDEQKKDAIGSLPIRLAMPKEGTLTFEDMIRGNVSFDLSLQDDPIILKSDGFPTYHLASVIDDHAMLISHVIRGEEWISSTPKHISLYNAFSWEPPAFAHLPMILGAGKSKLSKRHGAQSVLDYQKLGYLPDALRNFLVLLGWNPGTNQEIFSSSELIELFSLERVQKSPAIFNMEKLNWLSHHYISTLSDTALLDSALPWLKKAGCPTDQYSQKQLLLITKIAQQRISFLSAIGEETAYLWDTQPIQDPLILIEKKSSIEHTVAILAGLIELFQNNDISENTPCEEITNIVEQWREQQGHARGEILWPLRVSVTRLKHSPGVYETIQIIGSKETIVRLNQARDLLSSQKQA